MQLKIQRSQRMGGMVGNTVHFCLDVRADYAPDEAANISKYKIGRELVYSSRAAQRHATKAGDRLDQASDMKAGFKGQMTGLVGGIYSLAMAKMNLNISIASLGKGHHIECKDLPELMEAEEAVMQACRNVRDYLGLAATFNGSTILVDFTGKDEQVHTAMGGEVYAQAPLSLSSGNPAVIDAEFEDAPAPGAPVEYQPDTVRAELLTGGPINVAIERWWAELPKRPDFENILLVAIGILLGLVLLGIYGSFYLVVIAALCLMAAAFTMRDHWRG